MFGRIKRKYIHICTQRLNGDLNSPCFI